MEFVAIDFETANRYMHSACSLGMAIVNDLNIIDTRYRLIRPPDMYFHPINISVHGIKPDDVRNEPQFHRYWKSIRNYIDNKLVIAHNAAFDVSVLRSVLNHYGLSYPTFNYTCSCKIARKVWRGLESYNLHAVSDHLGIELQHHNALSDSIACAKIAIKAFDTMDIKTIDDIKNKLKVKVESF
jgi:DNA polymerase III subunit epsilon